jgi:hypothetical protein
MSEQDRPGQSPDQPAATSAPGVEASAPPPRRAQTIALAIGVVVLVVGVWLVIAKLTALLNAPSSGQAPAQATDTATVPTGTRRIHVSLFYVSESGLELKAVGRDILYGASVAEQARRIIEAQVHAPPDGQASAIPPETTVRSVYIGSKGEAYVDLGPEIVQHHGGGALNEALAVYAIVNALTTNLQDIRSVQILIDGKEVDTLAGHIDLRRPISKAPEWIQKVSRPPSDTTATARPGG